MKTKVSVCGWEDRDGRGREVCIKDIAHSKKTFIVAGQRKSARGRLTVYDPETGCGRAGATGPVNVQR